MASGAWSNTNTTSLTLPTGAMDPEQRITLDGTSDTILVYDATGALIASVAATAGTDAEGNNYPAGISATAGIISQSIILLYNGTPAAGNLVISLTSTGGQDTFGNSYQAGFSVYDSNENTVRSIALNGIDTIGSFGEAQFTMDPTTGEINLFNSAGVETAVINAENGAMLFYNETTTSQTFTASGTFVVPANITTIDALCYGGGGGGQFGSGAGGGGGEFAREPALVVTPGETLTVHIATSGTGGTSGTPHGGNGGSSFVARGATNLVLANGGPGSTGATNTGGTGSHNSIHFNGGGSSTSGTGLSHGGGGGGGSGGTGSAGNAGHPNSGTTGGAGAAFVTGGAAGGAGGNGTGTAGTVGTNGVNPGGGGGAGGSGSSSGSNGGTGGRGQVKITYTNTETLEVSIAAIAGTDDFGNTYPSGIQIGKATGSHIYMNPTGPVIDLYDSTNTLNGVVDVPGAKITVGDATEGIVATMGINSFGPTFTSGFFTGPMSIPPTSTELSNAAQFIVDGGLNTVINSLNLGAGSGADDPVFINLGPGDTTAAYTAFLEFFTSKPLQATITGQLQESTSAYGIITLPGTAGGGTTSFTVTGLGLDTGPNGGWMVLLTANTTVPGTDLKYVSYSGASSDGFTAHMNRTTNTNTSVSYYIRGM